MGIQGLLPLLKSITHETSLEQLRGKTVAIDTLCWLHRGIYSCTQQLALGQPTRAYVKFCESMLDLLLHFGIIPYFVFDGSYLPAKREKEEERRGNRESALREGRAAHAAGDAAGAQTAFARAVDVTPQMAYEFIVVLRRRGLAFVVAPYEADAQLAFLYREGIVDAVITEDSDLLPYGARRVLYKLDRASGTGQEIELDRLVGNGDPSFLHWTDDMFLSFCVLAGCDYLSSLPGFGPRKAHAFVSRHKTQERIVQMLSFENPETRTGGYLDGFRRARLTFMHQRVFDPRSSELVTLTPLPAQVITGTAAGSLDFLGPVIPHELAREEEEGGVWNQERRQQSAFLLSAHQSLPHPSFAGAIAYGNIDPITLQPYIENGPAPLPRGVAPAPAAAEGAGPPGSTVSSYVGAGHKGAAGAAKATPLSSAGARPVGVLLGARQTKPSPSPLKGMFSADMQRTRATAAASAGAAVPSAAAYSGGPRHSPSPAAAAAASAAATSFSLSSLARPSVASVQLPSSRPFSFTQTPGPRLLPVAALGSGDPKRFGLAPRLPFAPLQHFAASEFSGRDATPSARRPPEVDLTREQDDDGGESSARGHVVSTYFASRAPAAPGAGSCVGRGSHHQDPQRQHQDALARGEGLTVTPVDTGESGHAGDSCITTPASPEHFASAAAETRARPAPTAVAVWDDVGDADAAMLDGAGSDVADITSPDRHGDGARGGAGPLSPTAAAPDAQAKDGTARGGPLSTQLHFQAAVAAPASSQRGSGLLEASAPSAHATGARAAGAAVASHAAPSSGSRLHAMLQQRSALGLAVVGPGAPGGQRSSAGAAVRAAAPPCPPDLFQVQGGSGAEVLTLGERPAAACVYHYHSGDDDAPDLLEDEGGGLAPEHQQVTLTLAEVAEDGSSGRSGRPAVKRKRTPYADDGGAGGLDMASSPAAASVSSGAGKAAELPWLNGPRKRSAGLPRLRQTSVLLTASSASASPVAAAAALQRRVSGGNKTVGRHMHPLRGSPAGGSSGQPAPLADAPASSCTGAEGGDSPWPAGGPPDQPPLQPRDGVAAARAAPGAGSGPTVAAHPAACAGGAPAPPLFRTPLAELPSRDQQQQQQQQQQRLVGPAADPPCAAPEAAFHLGAAGWRGAAAAGGDGGGSSSGSGGGSGSASASRARTPGSISHGLFRMLSTGLPRPQPPPQQPQPQQWQGTCAPDSSVPAVEYHRDDGGTERGGRSSMGSFAVAFVQGQAARAPQAPPLPPHREERRPQQDWPR